MKNTTYNWHHNGVLSQLTAIRIMEHVELLINETKEFSTCSNEENCHIHSSTYSLCPYLKLTIAISSKLNWMCVVVLEEC